MRISLSIVATIVACVAGAFVASGHAQTAPAQPARAAADAELEVLHVKGNIYAIFGAGGNVVVSAGKDGVLVVDTGMAQNADKLLLTIQRLQKQVELKEPPPGIGWGAETRGTLQMSLNPLAPPKPIRFIVNTHAHADHVGGNAKLKKAGKTFTGGNVAGDISDAGEGAMVIAHENVINRMVTPPGNQKPAPEDALPTDTFFGDSMKLSHFFNGEGIQFFHPKNAHTDGDTFVFFRGSDVIVAGDLFVMTTYPFIDLERGGTINGIIDSINHMLDLTVPEFRLEGGTMVVPGHGRITDSGDLAYYRDMLTIIRDRVQDMVKKGMTLEQVKAAHPTKDYDPRWGATSGFWTTDQFVEAIYKNLSSKPAAKPTAQKPSTKGGAL